MLVETVLRIDAERKRLTTVSGREVAFDALCLCVGAAPKVTDSLVAASAPADFTPNLQKLLPADWPVRDLFDRFVLTIRDTESVEALSCRLSGARRVLLVGSGGVAMEFVHAVGKIRDPSIV